MKFFITGANGLVGSYLVKELLSLGHTIKALRRTSSDLSLLGNASTAIEWIEGSIMDCCVLEESMTGCDYVIHVAAMVSFHPGKRNQMYDTNVIGTANVVNAALTTGIRKLCFVSSIAALGKEKDDKPVTEKTQWEESEQFTHYGRSKYLSELEVWRGIEEGLNAVIVNPGVILGPGDPNKSSTRLFEYVKKGGRFYTSGTLNYVDLRDVVDCIVKLTLGEIQAQRFILNAGSVSYKDFFAAIANELGIKAPNRKVSPLIGEIAWRLVAIKSLFSSSEPLITKETVRLGRRPTHYENDKILNTLSIKFKSLSETVQWTCSSMNSPNS